MAYDLSALGSYVRFYLAVLGQVEGVWAALTDVDRATLAALSPYAEPLAPAEHAGLAEVTAWEPGPPPELAELWRPADATGLTGLTDVYEVVGRFSFQGDRGENLARVQALVAEGRNRVQDRRRLLGELEGLPKLAADTAKRLREAELHRAAAERLERTKRLEELCKDVLARAKQTSEALHSVAIPELASEATAQEEYQRLRAKFGAVYQTLLPFLRSAISQVWAYVEAPVPQSFPDELPFVLEIPPELLTVAPEGAEALGAVERAHAALGDEEASLARAKDDLTARLAKFDGALTALAAKRAERMQAVGLAKVLHEWTRLGAERAALMADQARAASELEQRVARAGAARERAERMRASLVQEAEELARRSTQAEELGKELETTRAAEPMLFGKAEWRAKVAALEAQVEELRAYLGQVGAQHNQRRIELSALDVGVQTAFAEQSLGQRALADLQARTAQCEQALQVAAAQLGADRPTAFPSLAEAEQLVQAAEAQVLEVDSETERLRGEQRRTKDDGLRVLARQREVAQEQSAARGRLEAARVQASEGREAAQRKLALRRRAAVAQHVADDVLGVLSKSLAQVGEVFLDPARELLRQATSPRYEAADAVRAAGEALGPVLERLAAEEGAALDDAEELLGRVQREFCDVAADACRGAFG